MALRPPNPENPSFIARLPERKNYRDTYKYNFKAKKLLIFHLHDFKILTLGPKYLYLDLYLQYNFSKD